MNEVFNWLKNPNRSYTEGVELYNKYKTTTAFDKFFADVKNGTPSTMQINLLYKRVSDINRKLLSGATEVVPEKTNKIIEVVQINTGKKTERPVIVDNPLIDVKELPENLQKLYFENKGLTIAMAGKHAELAKLGTSQKDNDKAKVLAEEICSIEDKRTANWNEIDTWYNNKKKGLEVGSQNTSKTIGDIAKRISNLENYIRREKAKMENNPKNAAKYQAKIDKWKEELDGIRK